MSPRPTILDHAAVLSEATRCRILQLLDRQELTVSELMSVLQLPQSTASRHLKVLAEGGWVRSRRDGTSHLYQLAADSLDEAAGNLWDLIRDQTAETTVSRQDARRLESVLRARRSRSETFFTETASEWDRLRDDLFGRRFDLHALLALLDRRWVVGDLGCGTGRTSEALAPYVDRVYAVDGSGAMLEAARQRLEHFDNVTFREGELERLPIVDGRLDAAVLFLALHHVPDPARVVSEARRVTAPGGRLLVVDMQPHDREDYRRRMGHVWLGFSREQLLSTLTAAGFQDAVHQSLPADPEAKGPTLFVATATAPAAAPAVTEPVEAALVEA